MFHQSYGPHGAEEERTDYWQDISEGDDMLHDGCSTLPPSDRMKELASLAGFAVQDPYGPAMTDELDTEDTQGRYDPDADTNADTDAGNGYNDPAQEIRTDPLGSWTGTPDADEIPTQDQDDL